MDATPSEQSIYEGFARQTIRDVLGEETFQREKLEEWTEAIIHGTLDQLKISTTKKYIVTCHILQKTGSGLNTSTSCRWDDYSDVFGCVRWENESITCIVCVYGMKMIYGRSEV